MAIVKDIINQLHTYSLEDHIACPIWIAEDIFDQAKRDNRIITETDANNILDEIHRKHDAELGITWTTISCCLESYPSIEDVKDEKLNIEIDRIVHVITNMEMNDRIDGKEFVKQLCKGLLYEYGIYEYGIDDD